MGNLDPLRMMTKMMTKDGSLNRRLPLGMRHFPRGHLVTGDHWAHLGSGCVVLPSCRASRLMSRTKDAFDPSSTSMSEAMSDPFATAEDVRCDPSSYYL